VAILLEILAELALVLGAEALYW